MSNPNFALPYFPPKGTKYEWGTKALNYSPWGCRIFDYWPATVSCHVGIEEDGAYWWRVYVIDFDHDRYVHEGTAETGLGACLAAEEQGDAAKARIWLPWMDEAVAAGWRPPA